MDRTLSTIRWRCRSLSTVLPLAVILVSGCGLGRSTAAPVDAEKALTTLQAVLQDWQEGGSLQAWRDHTPEVVIQDGDWTAGKTLKKFEILGRGEPRDANLFCQVRLTLETPGQPSGPQTVTYVVGTDPVLTVFRGLPE